MTDLRVSSDGVWP